MVERQQLPWRGFRSGEQLQLGGCPCLHTLQSSLDGLQFCPSLARCRSKGRGPNMSLPIFHYQCGNCGTRKCARSVIADASSTQCRTALRCVRKTDDRCRRRLTSVDLVWPPATIRSAFTPARSPDEIRLFRRCYAKIIPPRRSHGKASHGNLQRA